MIVREKEVFVHNRFGVHGRVATRLAQIASRHEVQPHLLHGGETIDCSSVLDVLSMAFAFGSSFTVRVAGDEEMVTKTFLAVERVFAGEEESQSAADNDHE